MPPRQRSRTRTRGWTLVFFINSYQATIQPWSLLGHGNSDRTWDSCTLGAEKRRTCHSLQVIINLLFGHASCPSPYFLLLHVWWGVLRPRNVGRCLYLYSFSSFHWPPPLSSPSSYLIHPIGHRQETHTTISPGPAHLLTQVAEWAWLWKGYDAAWL